MLLSELLGTSSLRRYPTKEKILANPPKHKREIIQLTKQWKKETWDEARQSNPRGKFEAIKSLVDTIAFAYDKPVTVEFTPDTPIGCHYTPADHTIVIDAHVSIISALHELAHHLFGASELKACRWSVWLFRKVFPKAYSQLIWNQHMLVKPTCPTQQIESTSASMNLSE